MNPYEKDFPTDNPDHWHDEAARRDALEALEAGDLDKLEKVFYESRGLSLKGIIRAIIEARL